MKISFILALLLLLHVCRAQSPSVWRNHGKDFFNSRHQDSNLLNKLTADQLSLFRTYTWQNVTPSFKPQGSVSCTPSIYGNTLYYTDFNGNLLAYDKLDGSNVYWEYVPNVLFTTTRQDAFCRSTPSLDGSYVFYGTTDASPTVTGLFPGPTVIRLDKDTGLNEGARALTSDPTQIITMSGTSFDDTYFVGLSTQQSLYALTVPNFQCCSAVGTFYKLDSDLNTLWSFNTISNTLPIGPNGYSGASVWGSSPVIVETEEIVYITTGQNHNLPQYVKDCLLANPNNTMVCWEEGNYADSIIALNYTTGELIWHYTTRVDAWNAACLDPQSPNYSNCPQPTGPDGDFGMDVMYIESQYEECQDICECAFEIVHDGMMKNTESTNTILDGVDRILSLITGFFTGSEGNENFSGNDDDDDNGVNIFANNIHLNQFSSSSSSSDSTKDKSSTNSKFIRKSGNSPNTIKEYEISFASSVGNKNCNYFPCYRENYDCQTCYPFTDAKSYSIVSTRGLYSFDSIITGNIALTPSSNLYGVPPTIVNGVIDINNSAAMAAHQDMLTAYESISNCTCDVSITGDFDMNGASLLPGVYCISGNAWLNSTLVLPSVNPGGLEYSFIIQGNLTFYSGSSITITGENTACNINWLADRIIGEQNSQLYGTFFSRDDIVIYVSQVFGRLFTLSGPIITYETSINPCECRYVPVSPTPSTSSTSTSTSTSSATSTSTSSATPSSSTSPIPSTTSTASSSMTPSTTPSPISPSPSSSTTLLPSASVSPTFNPSCTKCPDLDQLALSYGILGTFGVINTGLSVINSNVASQVPLNGFPPGIITGSIDINNGNYFSVLNQATLNYNKYINCPCQSQGNMVLSDSVITPGFYCYDRLRLSGTVTFDSSSNVNGVYIFVVNQLNIDDLTIMNVIQDGSLLGCNVVFVSRTTINVGSITSILGTYISQGDITYSTSLPIGSVNNLLGQLYSINSKVLPVGLIQVSCSCNDRQSPSSTPSPSMSPSSIPPSCRNCYPNDIYKSFGLSGASIRNTQTLTTIDGDVSSYTVTPLVNFPPATYSGILEQNNLQSSAMQSTVQDMFNFYRNCQCDQSFSQTTYSTTTTFTPGIYCYNRFVEWTFNTNIIIDVTSNPSGIVIIKSNRINFYGNNTMTLIGGTLETCNVFFISEDISGSNGIIDLLSGGNDLFGTFIAEEQFRMQTSPLNNLPSSLRGHIFTVEPITSLIILNKLTHTLCSCGDRIIPSISATPSISPSMSSSVTQTTTCTCTPTPTITPQKRCDCQCDLQGNTHVPRYSLVLAADKAGVAYGINAETGSEIWKSVIGPGGTLGGSSWGGTNDGKKYAYYNIINNDHKEWRLTPSNEVTTSGGWVKIDMWTGAIVWSVRVPEDPLNPVQELWATGPPTLVNDILVTTSVNGHVYLIDTDNGSILWNEHVANTIYGGASADNTNCIYVGSGYSASFGLLEDNRVFQFCIGEPISYSVEV